MSDFIEAKYMTDAGGTVEFHLSLYALCNMNQRDFRKALMVISKDYERQQDNANKISIRLFYLQQDEKDPRKKAAYQKKEEIRQKYLPSWR